MKMTEGASEQPEETVTLVLAPPLRRPGCREIVAGFVSSEPQQSLCFQKPAAQTKKRLHRVHGRGASSAAVVLMCSNVEFPAPPPTRRCNEVFLGVSGRGGSFQVLLFQEKHMRFPGPLSKVKG